MIQKIGRSFLDMLSGICYFSGYFFTLLKETFLFPTRKRIGFKVLIMQIYFTGVEALATISLISLGIGATIIIQGVSLLNNFGQGNLTYKILIMIITRELGPLLTAFILTARSGSAITTELGNMVISHEIQAYLSVGINPISLLAVPRFIGVVTAMFFLNIYFNLFGLMGSYLVSSFTHQIPILEYVRSLVEIMTMEDVLSSVIKSFVFGSIIGIVSTYYGFSVNHAITEVPQKTIKSIASSIVWCIIADVIIVLISRL